jgi:hypothetical protein
MAIDLNSAVSSIQQCDNKISAQAGVVKKKGEAQLISVKGE